jgi:hypothetical protein
MNRRFIFWLSLVVCWLCGAEARAHFLFIRVGPPAEGGRFAEVYFSDQATAGDPHLLDKITQTQLWVQSDPGKFQPLKIHKGSDRLRASLPGSAGAVSVIGVCEYGVLQRGKKPPFLLRYYPKAVAGNPDEFKRLELRKEIPLEITTAVDGERIRLTAMRQGKPIPEAVFHTVASDLSNDKVTADRDGNASWKPPAAGYYAVYVSHTLKEEGTVGGKAYEEIREYATLAFTWPLVRKDADPEAVKLFEEALAARARWEKFPGFTAHIAGKVDGQFFEGEVTIDGKGEVQLETKERAAGAWAREQLESVALHRGAGGSDSPAAERPKPVLRFADDETDHPLGRLLIFEGGSFASSYRVKDRQILVVNRLMGKQNMTITVLDNERNREGAFLPRSFTVQYWDAATGELRRTETVQQRWQRVGSWDLPAEHTATNATSTGLSVRSFTLTRHQLREAK